MIGGSRHRAANGLSLSALTRRIPSTPANQPNDIRRLNAMPLTAAAVVFVGLAFLGPPIVSGQQRSPQGAATAAAAEAQLMQFIYGNFDARTRTSRWTSVTKAALDLLSIDTPATFVAHMGGAFPFLQNGERKILFVTWSTPPNFDCHACAPVVSAAVFTQAAGNWKVAVADPAVTVAGGFGKPGTFKLERVGENQYGLVVETGFTGQGDTSQLLTLHVPDGPKFKTVLQLDTHMDNGGSCGPPAPSACYSYDAKYRLEPKPGQEYHDIVVTTTGTKIGANGRVVPATGTARYVFSAGEYKERR
jgi:hypothetical protein